MQGFIHTAAFAVYPYIALSVFLIGSLVRFDTDQYGWRSKSSQFLRRRQLVWGSILFHVGIESEDALALRPFEPLQVALERSTSLPFV